MKEIADEEVILKNLQNIRIAYGVQIIGISFILGYYFLQDEFKDAAMNPIWIAVILIMIISFYLLMTISIKRKKHMKNPNKIFLGSVIGLIAISLTFGYFVSNTANANSMTGVNLGTILLLYGLIPLYYIYRLKIKQNEKFENK